MITATTHWDEELAYAISFRQVRRVEREDAPPPGWFETIGCARLARESKYRWDSSCAQRGIRHRGTVKDRILLSVTTGFNTLPSHSIPKQYKPAMNNVLTICQ